MKTIPATAPPDARVPWFIRQPGATTGKLSAEDVNTGFEIRERIIVVWVPPPIRRNLPRLGQLDQVHGRHVTAFAARPAFQ